MPNQPPHDPLDAPLSGPCYPEPNRDELWAQSRILEKQFNTFLRLSKYPPDVEVFVNKYAIMDLAVRMDKRRHYFYYFHKRMTISECKSVALLAYWILKFHPFTLVDSRYRFNKHAQQINEYFALYCICCVLLSANRLKHSPKEKSTYFQKLLYSFRYRNISIDAILVLVDSISTDTFDFVHLEIE